jgi:hypothetical protein
MGPFGGGFAQRGELRTSAQVAAAPKQSAPRSIRDQESRAAPQPTTVRGHFPTVYLVFSSRGAQLKPTV